MLKIPPFSLSASICPDAHRDLRFKINLNIILPFQSRRANSTQAVFTAFPLSPLYLCGETDLYYSSGPLRDLTLTTLPPPQPPRHQPVTTQHSITSHHINHTIIILPITGYSQHSNESLTIINNFICLFINKIPPFSINPYRIRL